MEHDTTTIMISFSLLSYVVIVTSTLQATDTGTQSFNHGTCCLCKSVGILLSLVIYVW